MFKEGDYRCLGLDWSKHFITKAMTADPKLIKSVSNSNVTIIMLFPPLLELSCRFSKEEFQNCVKEIKQIDTLTTEY